jgi:hypothetical protein
LSSILFGSHYFFYFSIGDLRSGACYQNPTGTTAGAARPGISGHFLDPESHEPEKYFQEIGNGLSLFYENFSQGPLAGGFCL